MTAVDDSPAAENPSRTRHRPRERMFVRLVDPDGVAAFVDVTRHLGRPLPVTRPRATCAVRVTASTVTFSLLHLTARSASRVAAATTGIPHGSLSRLERICAATGPLPAGVLQVQHECGTAEYRVSVDDAGVARLDLDDDSSDVLFTLAAGSGDRLTLLMDSPVVARRLGVTFVGHLGKPGSAETLRRAASKVLASLSGLAEFRLLTGITAVSLPAGPGRATAPPAPPLVEHTIPVWLFTSGDVDVAPQPVCEARMTVGVDLEHANQATGRLLLHLSLHSAEHVDVEPYRSALERWVSTSLETLMGSEEVSSIVFDVILGAVDDRTVQRVVEGLQGLPALMATPTQVRPSA